jgi:putative membrane protein
MHTPARAAHLWPSLLLLSCLAIFIWSGIAPRDRTTWVLEVAPVIVGVPVLVATYRRFRFTPLLYVLMWVHALVLMLGGHWTYAEMPLFGWLRDALHWQRNYYDRLGHLAQGFIPVLVARELLLRTSPLRPGKWLAFIVVSICLAISAGYELFEWAAAVGLGQGADQFLATQGDPWDTQADMLWALVGAVLGLVCLSRRHNAELRRLGVLDGDRS